MSMRNNCVRAKLSPHSIRWDNPWIKFSTPKQNPTPEQFWGWDFNPRVYRTSLIPKWVLWVWQGGNLWYRSKGTERLNDDCLEALNNKQLLPQTLLSNIASPLVTLHSQLRVAHPFNSATYWSLILCEVCQHVIKYSSTALRPFQNNLQVFDDPQNPSKNS